MATVGNALTAPETGWRRYDDNDSNISYIDNWINFANANAYSGAWHYAVSTKKEIRFNFTGSKIRIISPNWNTYSSSISIQIDDNINDTFSQYVNTTSTMEKILSYEKTGLLDTEHYVVIRDITNKQIALDAIDIYASGVLKPYNENIFNPMYLINQGVDYYYINNNYLKLGTPTDNSQLANWIKDYGHKDIGILVNPLTSKKVPTTFDITNTYKSFDIDLNDVTGSNIGLVEEDAKKFIQYDCNGYKIIDKIKLNNGGKFDVLMKEI